MGATTVWERWDSLLPDGSVNPGEMTSFNHYAFGAIADWLHRVVAGLGPAAPGFRELTLAPHPLPGLDWARTSHETPYGRASVGWQRHGDTIVVDAVVPANTTATMRLPGAAETLTVGSGSHQWEVAAPASENGRGPVTLDTPLAEVIDDQEAFDAFLAAFRGRDEAKAREFCDHTRWLSHLPLGMALSRVPGEIRDDLRGALESVNRGRAG
jgi:alpha-L-rhamnosidase